MWCVLCVAVSLCNFLHFHRHSNRMHKSLRQWALQVSQTQLYSRPRNVSSFSSCGKGYGFLDDSGVTKTDGRRLVQHFVSAGVTNVARVAVDIAPAIRASLSSGRRLSNSQQHCHHGNSHLLCRRLDVLLSSSLWRSHYCLFVKHSTTEFKCI